uniref:Kinesin-like protein KIF24 n=1 Tax=Xenopus tropicalis TaxID=8364 RepID=A0A803J3L8_XENTR
MLKCMPGLNAYEDKQFQLRGEKKSNSDFSWNILKDKKMPLCLFECLCEADLQQYYPRFAAVGLQKIDELAQITMKDYSRLGVERMEDRKRLFQLIQIIQSVAEEDKKERTPLQPGCVYPQLLHDRSGARRQLQFDASIEETLGTIAQSEFCHIRSMNNPGDSVSTASPADPRYCRNIHSSGTEADTTCSAKTQNTKTLPHRGSAPDLSDGEIPIIHRVAHVLGYNYGVPQTCRRLDPTEKKRPWTETDRIRVCVRKRPLSSREERRGEVNVVSAEEKGTITIYERKEAVNLKEYILQHAFYFDEVFSETFTNQDVYMRTAYPLIQHVFNGGNATCFAYGQTGAGKTHTMIGTQKNPGLYALAAKDIFQQLATVQLKSDCKVWISFYEIYCGQLYDLLNERKRLYAREDGKHVVQIAGLREVQVSSVELLLEMILKGSRERSTGASGVNSDSSRSHAVIQIQMKNSKNRKLGRISFIDLAGSERASDAKESDKQTKLEGAEINQSLLALKECIRALDQEQAHTPFRQSKLTQVLKDSFIGNSKTCMIANVSPSHIATEHTLNTLRYADRVKELKRGTTSHSAHGRPAACVSPKRVQNAPAGSGDKISPKKVKLGQQHISASHQAKSKSCPSVFHPTIIPLSSTPKYCSKSSTVKENARDAGLNHMTPVKGTLRSGASGKKKNGKTSDGLYPIFQSPTTSNTETTCEMRNIKRENFVGTQKVPKVQIIQAVQPVQKEIVPRPGLLANPNYRALSKGLPDEIPRPTVNTVAGRAGVHPQPKEREQHLRSYYKQFQQPPIFQQKLHYQPLEKIFAQYKPQSIKVTSSIDPVHPSSPLEDLDDSDFSEDSFSYSSNHKQGRNEVEVGENISFFLHQDSPVKELGKSAEMKKGLCFSDKDPQLFDQGVGWRHGNNANTQGREHPDKNVMPTSWSSEMDSSAILNGTIDSPEKPYSSQEDLETPLSKRTTWHNPNLDKGMGSSLNCSFKEHSVHSKAKGPCEGCVSVSSHSVSGVMAPLTVSLLQDNWSFWSDPCLAPQELSARSENGAKNLNCIEGWSVDAPPTLGKIPTDEPGGQSHESATDKQCICSNKALKSFCGEKGWFPGNSGQSYSSSSSRSPSAFVHQEWSVKGSRNASLSARGKQSDSSHLTDTSLDVLLKSSGQHGSRFYDADTEDTTDGLKGVGNGNKAEEESPFGRSTDKNIIDSNDLPAIAATDEVLNCNMEHPSFKEDFRLPLRDDELECLKAKLLQCLFSQGDLKKEPPPNCVMDIPSPKNSTSVDGEICPSKGPGHKPRALERAQQLVIQAHREQLNEIADLCSREEVLLSHINLSVSVGHRDVGV